MARSMGCPIQPSSLSPDDHFKRLSLSSRIEGTQATLGNVLKFEAGEEPKQKARKFDIEEINNYREALRHAERALKKKPFHLNLLLELHAICSTACEAETRVGVRFAPCKIGSVSTGRPWKKQPIFRPRPRESCL